MVQGGQDLGLTLESREPVRVVGHGRWEDLEGDVTLQLAIAGAVNFSHPPRPKGRADLVRAESSAGEKGHG